MGKGYFGKAVRGFTETRHDRLGREKIVVSGTDGSVRRQRKGDCSLEGPLGVLFRYQAFVLRRRGPSFRQSGVLLLGRYSIAIVT